MTARVRLIEHGIVLQDFSNLADSVTALAAFQEARAFMQQRPRNARTLVLTNVTDSTFNQEVVNDIRALAVHHKPWVRASAIFGLTPIMRVVCRAVLALTGRDIRIFETSEQAVEYLLSINDPASAEPASPQKPAGPPSGRR